MSSLRWKGEQQSTKERNAHSAHPGDSHKSRREKDEGGRSPRSRSRSPSRTLNRTDHDPHKHGPYDTKREKSVSEVHRKESGKDGTYGERHGHRNGKMPNANETILGKRGNDSNGTSRESTSKASAAPIPSAPVQSFVALIEVICNDRLGKKIRVKCSPDDTVGDFKKLLAAQIGTAPEKIVLKKWYNSFKDHVTLSDYEIHNGMSLEMYYN